MISVENVPEPEREGALNQLSVIIPVGPRDDAWQMLLADLTGLPEGCEILLAGITEVPPEVAGMASQVAVPVHWIVSPRGRARQMNLAARAARGRFLWFLHADSRVSSAALHALDVTLQSAPEALHFFDLGFLPDGPRGMSANAAGVRLRSRLLGLPFGDQGLCLSAKQFTALGGYDETARYGEDHLLVWSAHRQGVALRCTQARLLTSARKYRERGWLRTTARHVWLTIRQAAPQYLLLIQERIQRCLRLRPPLPSSSRPPDSRR